MSVNRVTVKKALRECDFVFSIPENLRGTRFVSLCKIGMGQSECTFRLFAAHFLVWQPQIGVAKRCRIGDSTTKAFQILQKSDRKIHLPFFCFLVFKSGLDRHQDQNDTAGCFQSGFPCSRASHSDILAPSTRLFICLRCIVVRQNVADPHQTSWKSHRKHQQLPFLEIPRNFPSSDVTVQPIVRSECRLRLRVQHTATRSE